MNKFAISEQEGTLILDEYNGKDEGFVWVAEHTMSKEQEARLRALLQEILN